MSSELLDAVFGRTGYIPKEAWGYRQRTSSRPVRRLDQFRGVEVHHGGDKAPYRGSTDAALMGIIKSYERYHYDTRNWWAIFYNVFVCPNTGRVAEGRPWQYWSTSDKDAEWFLTVNLPGNTDLNGISAEAMESVRRIWRYVEGTMRGHKERPYPTGCPGLEGMDMVRALRASGPGTKVPDESRALILPPELISDLEHSMKIISVPEEDPTPFYCLWADGRLEKLDTMGQVDALKAAGALERQLSKGEFRNLLTLQDPTVPTTSPGAGATYTFTGTAKPKG